MACRKSASVVMARLSCDSAVVPEQAITPDASATAHAVSGIRLIVFPPVRGLQSQCTRRGHRSRPAPHRMSCCRVASSVEVSFSRGTPLMNGRRKTLSNRGMPRLSVIDSHCM